MKSNWYFSLILLLLSACINGEQTFTADHTHWLSGGNSKVWMLKGTQQLKYDELHQSNWGEILFVFYLTGEVLVGSFSDFDKGVYDKGYFKFHEKKEQLSIQVGKEKWVFKLKSLDAEHLVLEKRQGGNIAPYLHLVPLPLPH